MFVELSLEIQLLHYMHDINYLLKMIFLTLLARKIQYLRISVKEKMNMKQIIFLKILALATMGISLTCPLTGSGLWEVQTGGL